MRVSPDARDVRFETGVSPSQVFSSIASLPNGGFLSTTQLTNRFIIPPNPNQQLRSYGPVHRFAATGDLIAETLIGGTSNSNATAAAADQFGNILTAGTSQSIDMPLKAAVEMSDTSQDSGFLTKFDPVLKERIYSTHIRQFRPVAIFPQGPGKWLLVGSGLPAHVPNPTLAGVENITFIYVTETKGTFPRIDRLTGRPSGALFLSDRYFLPADTVTLSGEWPDPTTTASIDESPVPTEYITSKTLRLTLPSDLKSGFHTVRAHSGPSSSNALTFPVP